MSTLEFTTSMASEASLFAPSSSRGSTSVTRKVRFFVPSVANDLRKSQLAVEFASIQMPAMVPISTPSANSRQVARAPTSPLVSAMTP